MALPTIINVSLKKGDKVVPYSPFVELPGARKGSYYGYGSNAGFEEWAAITAPHLTVVPEPTTMIAGALLLLPFGASTLRRMRNRKQAA